MAAKYPATRGTQTDWTSGDPGMGRSKINDKSPRDLAKNFVAEEFNQHTLEIIATQTKVGTTLAEPPGFGDAVLGSHEDALLYSVARADLGSVIEHFTDSTWNTNRFEDVGAVGAFVYDGSAVGVGRMVLAAGVATGFIQNTQHWHQRSSLYRCRWVLSALPGTNGDLLEFGFYHDANNWVRIYSIRAGGAWPAWTCDVTVGGVPTTGAFVATPADVVYHTFEIMTSATGAVFWLDRGTANQERVAVAAPPEDAQSLPFILCTSTVGGENLDVDLIMARALGPTVAS